FLRQYDDINVVYCENDNEAIGAIEAIESEGKTVGRNIGQGEIMVLSFDGSSDQAIEAVRTGRIACIGECNPLHGPRVRKIIEDLKNGVTPEKYEYVDEDVFSSYGELTQITVDGTDYDIKIMK
ncbi:MAG: LacI family transcriptional regulator, partial [Lachnospiraceae bacterium]|nr:LacI family transcriptional regulator [Lachnospiraceae bacterium]